MLSKNIRSTLRFCAARSFSTLTHIDSTGKASMVDVSGKPLSNRFAVASAVVNLGEEAYKQVVDNTNKKGLLQSISSHFQGDVLAVARVAGIMGAKKTSELIPLCHTVEISKASVDFRLDEPNFAIKVIASAKTVGPTGVEMEALNAAAVAAMTIYDMCKAVSKSITITDLQLDQKTGGKSGDYNRNN